METGEQLALFDLTAKSATPFPENGSTPGNGAGFNDPAFAGNKTLPVHRWVPWIAGFARDFVADVLARYLHTPGTVLDPFSGVGTTLVEAVLGLVTALLDLKSILTQRLLRG